MNKNDSWDPEFYRDKHSYVYGYGESLIEILDPQPNERILDLGCGTGELTHLIAQKCQQVIGLDLSPDMIASARTQYPNLTFEVADATNFRFERPFHAIFSNAALHWILDPQKVVRCMYYNLMHGGRLVLEFGGKGNIASIEETLRAVLAEKGFSRQSQLKLWYFPSISEYAVLLESRGFEVQFAQLYDRPTELGRVDSDIKDWLTMFGKAFLDDIEPNKQEEIKTSVQERLKTELYREGMWYVDYRRLRVVAVKTCLGE